MPRCRRSSVGPSGRGRCASPHCWSAPKIDPAVVAKLALDGLAAGQPEVLADETSRQVQQGLAGGVAALYPQFA